MAAEGPEDVRSTEARERAERALVWLLHQLRDEEVALIVLGGLVPEVLTRGQEPPVPTHLGTTDVDVLLITHVEPELDLRPVEDALQVMGFDAEPEGWRWTGRVDGTKVKIEFLCDLEAYAENDVIKPPGCERLAAASLRGTGYVAQDFEWEELTGVLPDGTEVAVRARFAGLAGYLLSKCVAVRRRAAEKDFYDFPYVLIHNRAGGPAQAAEVLKQSKLKDALPALASTFGEVRARYHGPRDFGPGCYAEQMMLVELGADESTLRADAVSAVDEFFEALGLSRTST